MTKLSILVPTLPETYSIGMLARLRTVLDPQIKNRSSEVELIIHDAGRSMPTGTKRNELIKQADGDFIVFVDCDDLVPAYYVDEMLKAINKGPDVVTFVGHITDNGGPKERFVIKLGERYEKRGGVYYRPPNHLTAMKRSLVEHVKFQPIWIQEDYQWCMAIQKQGILKEEVHIQKDMYLYEFILNKPRR
jgi:glycosyltransferase involved in cell wall biosynthesis